MMRFHQAALLAAVASALCGTGRADEKEAQAVVDKAIKAAGGEEKLGKPAAFTWKSQGTITFNGEDNPITIQATAQGLDNMRSEFEGEFGGNKVQGVTVLKGDKGWRKFGDDTMPLDEEGLAREKRNMYLQLAPALLVPLKGKGFKLDSAADETVGDKPASVVKVTGPDGKDFTIAFDKETGLPVKTTATVVGFQNDEYKQETTFSAYKDFGGIKRASKASSKRDGQKFIETEVVEFKGLDKVPADAFNEP